MPAIFHINPSTTFSYSNFLDIPVFSILDGSKMAVSCVWNWFLLHGGLFTWWVVILGPWEL